MMLFEEDQEKTCPVCKEVSKQSLQLHYGGRVCFSCRAFFRRSHEKTATPSFKCKKDNTCKITLKTRRKCQKCRYLLCLKAGMKPDAVLTQDQKKVRFRKAIQKKSAASSSTSQDTLISADDDDDSSDDTTDHVPNPDPSHGPLLKYSNDEESFVAKQVKLFDEAWNTFNLGEDLVKDWVMFSFDVPLSKGFIPQHIKLFHARSLELLRIHSEFTDLPISEQRRLWNSSSIFGVALTASRIEAGETANDQILIVTGNLDRQPWLAEAMKRVKKRVTMEDANKITENLTQQDVKDYNRLVKNIATVIDNPEMFKLVYLCLLFCDQERNILNDVYQGYLNLIKRRQDPLYNDNPSPSDTTTTTYDSCIDDVNSLAIILKKIALTK